MKLRDLMEKISKEEEEWDDDNAENDGKKEEKEEKEPKKKKSKKNSKHGPFVSKAMKRRMQELQKDNDMPYPYPKGRREL